jgi:hypothetical protein
MSRSTSARLATAGGSLALVIALAGCGAIGDLLGGGSPQRDEETGQVTEGADVDVFQLKVGDCLNLADATEVSSAAVVPCSEPHTDEIYHEFRLPDGDWPGDDAIEQSAEEGCYEAFEGFVGVPYEDSALAYNYLTPTEEGWTDSSLQDRLIQCVVYEPGDGGAAEIEGSLEGAAR